MPQQLLASSRCIPSLQTALDRLQAAPAAGEPFVCSSHIPAAPTSSATGAGAQQGSWCCWLGDAPQCSQASPTQHPPPPVCVQAACPAHSCAGCIPQPIPSAEILPKAAPLAAHVPSQGLSPCPIAALSWAGPISLGLLCSLQWDSVSFPILIL